MENTVINDPEKRALTDLVQSGDERQDPDQADAWSVDGTFQIGAMPLQQGRESIRGFLRGFFSMGLFEKLHHRMVAVIERPDSVVYRAVAEYTLPNGETLASPYVNWVTYTREGGVLKFKTYQVFIDPSPLLATKG